VAADLKAALQLYRPSAAASAKIAALAVLAENGGYEPEDEEDANIDEDAAVAAALTEGGAENISNKEDSTSAEQLTSDAIVSSMLCGEAMMMSGSLTGDDNADRADWRYAVKGCKSISRLAALMQCFLRNADSLLTRVEEERDTLDDLLGMDDPKSRRTRIKKHNSGIPIWCNVRITDDFLTGKVEGYPWWPAQICEAIDSDVASRLKDLSKILISFVGEASIYMVSEKDARAFSAEEQEEDLSEYDTNTIKSLEESTLIAKRICRGRGILDRSPWHKKKSKSRIVVEEKKTAH